MKERVNSPELEEREIKGIVLTLLFSFVIVTVLFFNTISDLMYFGTLGLFGIFIWKWRFPSRYTFLFCMVLLVVTYISFLLLGTEPLTERAAVWFVLFFATGVVQQWKLL